MSELPPPGPERDALVATALGCTTWLENCWCRNDQGAVKAWGRASHNAACECSTTDAGAIAALEAWRKAGHGRWYCISSPGDEISADFEVHLNEECPEWDQFCSLAPTLGDAASRSIIEAAEAGKEGA